MRYNAAARTRYLLQMSGPYRECGVQAADSAYGKHCAL